MRCLDHFVHYKIKPNMPTHCMECNPPPVVPSMIGWFNGDGEFITVSQATRGSISHWAKESETREFNARMADLFGIDMSEWERVYHREGPDGWPVGSVEWVD